MSLNRRLFVFITSPPRGEAGRRPGEGATASAAQQEPGMPARPSGPVEANDSSAHKDPALRKRKGGNARDETGINSRPVLDELFITPAAHCSLECGAALQKVDNSTR